MSLLEFFNKQEWTFAKTYAEKAPHEYIVRGKINGSDTDFVNAVNGIRALGFKAKFWKSEHTYLYLNGYLYWTMGAPINETIVINRCKADDYDLNIYPKKRGKDGNVLQGN